MYGEYYISCYIPVPHTIKVLTNTHYLTSSLSSAASIFLSFTAKAIPRRTIAPKVTIIRTYYLRG